MEAIELLRQLREPDSLLPIQWSDDGMVRSGGLDAGGIMDDCNEVFDLLITVHICT